MTTSLLQQRSIVIMMCFYFLSKFFWVLFRTWYYKCTHHM